MARSEVNSYDWSDVAYAAACRLDDVSWRPGDTDEVRQKGRIHDWHYPIYPDEESFIRTYSQLCDVLNLSNPVKKISYTPDDEPELAAHHPHLLLPDSNELFDYIAERKPSRNQAMVLGVMLGLEGADFVEFLSTLKSQCPEEKWRSAPVLTYEQVHGKWNELMAELTPQYNEILGRERSNKAAPERSRDDEEETPETPFIPPDAKPAAAKAPEPVAEIAPADEPTAEAVEDKPKRRGRPPKAKDDAEDAPKRPRGRPRKNDTNIAAAPEEPFVDTSELSEDEVNIPNPDIRFFRRDNVNFNSLPFPVKLEACVSEVVGEGKNYVNTMSFLHALHRFSSSLNVNAEVQHLVRPGEHGLTRNEAVMMMVALGISGRDRTLFLDEAQEHFEDCNSSRAIKEGWHAVENPISNEDEAMLWHARPLVIADANRHSHISPKVPLSKPPVVEEPVAVEPPPPPPATPPVTTAPIAAEVESPPAVAETPPAPPAAEPPPPVTTTPEVVIAATVEPTAEEKTPRAEPKPVAEAKPAKEAKPEPKAKEPPPPVAPALSEEQMRTRQLAAVEKARAAITGMEKYDATAIARIATDMLLELADASPLSGESWRAKALSNACEGRINEQTFQACIRGRTISHESFAAKQATLALVPNLVVDEALREEVSNYLNGIPLQKVEKPGEELLAYVDSHHGNVKDYWRMIRHHHNRSVQDFCDQVLDLPKDAFTRLSMAKCSRNLSETDIVEQAADKLEINTPELRERFHTLVGSQPERSKLSPHYNASSSGQSAGNNGKTNGVTVTREQFNHCFDRDAAMPVNVEVSEGAGRSVALSRFVAMLMQVNNISTVKELADKVAEKAGLGDGIATQLQRQLGQCAMPSKALDAEQEKEIPSKSNRGIKKELAMAMARYAFPHEAFSDSSQSFALQTQCYSFLNSENYRGKVGPRAGWKDSVNTPADDEGYDGVAGGNLG